MLLISDSIRFKSTNSVSDDFISCSIFSVMEWSSPYILRDTAFNFIRSILVSRIRFALCTTSLF